MDLANSSPAWVVGDTKVQAGQVTEHGPIDTESAVYCCLQYHQSDNQSASCWREGSFWGWGSWSLSLAVVTYLAGCGYLHNRHAAVYRAWL